ncbi:hypothetical protein MMC32_000484 [Xylographa parallela]|nr:hypothetical protein [Xylographa parallela]
MDCPPSRGPPSSYDHGPPPPASARDAPYRGSEEWSQYPAQPRGGLPHSSAEYGHGRHEEYPSMRDLGSELPPHQSRGGPPSPGYGNYCGEHPGHPPPAPSPPPSPFLHDDGSGRGYGRSPPPRSSFGGPSGPTSGSRGPALGRGGRHPRAPTYNNGGSSGSKYGESAYGSNANHGGSGYEAEIPTEVTGLVPRAAHQVMTLEDMTTTVPKPPTEVVVAPILPQQAYATKTVSRKATALPPALITRLDTRAIARPLGTIRFLSTRSLILTHVESLATPLTLPDFKTLATATDTPQASEPRPTPETTALHPHPPTFSLVLLAPPSDLPATQVQHPPAPPRSPSPLPVASASASIPALAIRDLLVGRTFCYWPDFRLADIFKRKYPAHKALHHHASLLAVFLRLEREKGKEWGRWTTEGVGVQEKKGVHRELHADGETWGDKQAVLDGLAWACRRCAEDGGTYKRVLGER